LSIRDSSRTAPDPALIGPGRRTANCGPGQIELGASASVIPLTVRVLTGQDAERGVDDLGGEWVVVHDGDVAFAGGGLVVISEGTFTEVPGVGLSAGDHRVVIGTRGGVQAMRLEDALISEVEDTDTADTIAETPTGPEEWRILIFDTDRFARE
jgi:hypothetical protein